MNKILIIGGGAMFLFILASGIYFFTSGKKSDDLITQKSKLQEAIILAEGKLAQEKEKLNTLTKGLQDSFPLAVSVQNQMKKSFSLTQQTDFMFTDPYGVNPKFIIENLSTGSLINNARKQVNLILSEWQSKIDLLSVEEIDVNASKKIKQDVEIVKEFLEDLIELVDSLTPENSGLSQSQIDTYTSQLPSVEEVDEILISIEVAIENYNDAQTDTTETENNQSSQDTLPNTPPVTPEDVSVQQEVVVQAETEVIVLQEELEQVEEQIQQSSDTPTPTPTPDDTPEADPENENTFDEGDQNDTDDTTNTTPREIEPSQGIIEQPGEPRLIQGTDPY